MKILLFTDKTDYAKVIGLLADEIHKDIDVEVISDCQLVNVALSHPHDLIIIDDKVYDQLNVECFEILSKSQMDTIVFLQKKGNIKSYLALNVVDYFVSPLEWERIDLRLKKQFKRMMMLRNLEHEGEVSFKFVLKNKSEIQLIKYADILCFHKTHKLVKIYTTHGEYVTHDSLKHILTRLPKSFIRVHSSYIVNFSNATSIVDAGNRSFSIEFGDHDLVAMMSRKHAEELMHDTLNHYRLSFIKAPRKDK